MSVISAIFSGIGAFFLSLWGLFSYWLWIFAIPFTSIESIWLIVPVWLSWFFAEFFQEKEGTSFGNAISNGVVPLWAGVDWMRQITQGLIQTHASMSFFIFLKFFVSFIAIAFGLIIIIAGIKGKDYVHFAGRIRVVTYFVVMFTPLVYDLIRPNVRFFLAILLFFPIFYFLIEFIDQRTPKPKAVSLDEGGSHKNTYAARNPSNISMRTNNTQVSGRMQERNPYNSSTSNSQSNPQYLRQFK